MKILIVSDLKYVGGTEIASSITANSLRNLGYEVALFGAGGAVSEQLKADGFKHFSYETHTKNPLKIFVTIFMLARILVSEKIDIVHCQMARPVPWVWIAKQLVCSKAKIFWTCRGIHEKTYKKIVPLFNRMRVRALGNCKQEQQKLIKYGFKEDFTGYAYNAYRLSPSYTNILEPDLEPFIVGTLSALRPERRIDLFLEVAARILEKNINKKNVHFLICGDGPEKIKLEEYAERLGISDYVTFLGSYLDVVPFFKKIHICVSSITMEGDSGAGVSNSIVESMVMKVPVCAFDALAIKEIVLDKKTGRLIEAGNIEAMTDAILELWERADLRKQYSEAAFELIKQNCDPKSYGEKLVTYYRDM